MCFQSLFLLAVIVQNDSFDGLEGIVFFDHFFHFIVAVVMVMDFFEGR